MDIDQRVLRDLLRDSFSPDELIELCFDLGVPHADLTGQSHSVKVISLIGMMERNNRLPALVQAIISRRPGLKGSLSPEKRAIPVIIAAMTSDEAAGLSGEGDALTSPYLVGGQEFRPQPRDLVSFRAFSEPLSEDDVNELLGRYGPTREAWRPHNREPIGDLVRGMTDRLGYEAIFLSDIIFASDQASTNKRMRTAYDLQQTSCLLIIDGLSLFHPRLRYLLNASGLVTGAKPITTLLVAPVAPGCSDLVQRLEGAFKEAFASVFYRFEEYDMLCDFGSFNQRNLRRWLDNTLPQTAKIIGGEDPDAQRIASMRANVLPQEAGMGNLITGGIRA